MVCTHSLRVIAIYTAST